MHLAWQKNKSFTMLHGCWCVCPTARCMMHLYRVWEKLNGPFEGHYSIHVHSYFISKSSINFKRSRAKIIHFEIMTTWSPYHMDLSTDNGNSLVHWFICWLRLSLFPPFFLKFFFKPMKLRWKGFDGCARWAIFF